MDDEAQILREYGPTDPSVNQVNHLSLYKKTPRWDMDDSQEMHSLNIVLHNISMVQKTKRNLEKETAGQTTHESIDGADSGDDGEPVGPLWDQIMAESPFRL